MPDPVPLPKHLQKTETLNTPPPPLPSSFKQNLWISIYLLDYRATLKNMQTSSSGEGMACVGGLENFFLRMLEIISEG